VLDQRAGVYRVGNRMALAGITNFLKKVVLHQ
jgi:hypothetical protein